MRLFTLLLISSLSVMAGATIAPALPEMARAFPELENAESWVRRLLTVPALTAALGGPVAGAIMDRFGRRPLLFWAIAFYIVGGSAGLYAPNMATLLLSRAVLGFTMVALMSGATTLLADYYHESDRGRVLGYQAGFSGFGGVLFLVAGGWLAELHWRAPFAVYLLPLLYVPLIWKHLPESLHDDDEHGSPALGPPIFPSKGKLTIVYALAALQMTVFFVVPMYLPFRLEIIGNIEGRFVGLLLGCVNLCFALTSLCYRQLAGLARVSAIFALGFTVFAAGQIFLGSANGLVVTVAGLVCCGVGLGIVMPNNTVWATRGLPLRVRGRVVGGLSTSIYLGQFIAPFFSDPLGRRLGLTGIFLSYGGVLAILALAFGLRAYRRRHLAWVQS